MKALRMSAAPARILVVSGPAHGDILLATPLFAALKRAWPDARLHVLVYHGQAGILEGNPHVDRVLTASKHPGLGEYRRSLWPLIRRYDLAISTKQTDRSILYAWAAGRRRIGAVPRNRDAWKRIALQGWVLHDEENQHILLQNGALAGLLGIAFQPGIELPRRAKGAMPPSDISPREAYAVLHIVPGLPYKRWRPESWGEVAEYLEDKGLALVLTGGNGEDERRHLETVKQYLPPNVIDLAGRLSFAELAALLEDATVYVGTDTVATHMAAAAGVPTVALYGPESPLAWGPWPAGRQEPFVPYRPVPEQTVGNVTVLQSSEPCPTCSQGHCLRRSLRDRCCELMATLPAARVLAALERLPPGAPSDNRPPELRVNARPGAPANRP